MECTRTRLPYSVTSTAIAKKLYGDGVANPTSRSETVTVSKSTQFHLVSDGSLPRRLGHCTMETLALPLCTMLVCTGLASTRTWDNAWEQLYRSTYNDHYMDIACIINRVLQAVFADSHYIMLRYLSYDDATGQMPFNTHAHTNACHTWVKSWGHPFSYHSDQYAMFVFLAYTERHKSL